jgi:hypothetical protein
MRSRITLLACLAALAALLGAPSAGSSAQKLGFTATFAAPTHAPRVGQPWRYAIYVRKLPEGTPVAASAKRFVLLNGRKIDTVGWDKFRGVFRQTYYWPRVDRGKALVFQAQVGGPGGVKTFNYNIRVQ